MSLKILVGRFCCNAICSRDESRMVWRGGGGMWEGHTERPDENLRLLEKPMRNSKSRKGGKARAGTRGGSYILWAKVRKRRDVSGAAA